MQLKQFQPNRGQIPPAERLKHRGQWIAISPDGGRIVAAHADLATLDSLVIAAGEDPETVAFERIESDDVHLGLAEHD